MPIALTDDHRELGAVARSFLTGQKARAAARAALDADEEFRPPFWRELAELGWLGLHVDEAYGGSGFGLPELVVVIEELGHAVAPGAFVPTTVVSAVLTAVGTEEQKARLLPGLIDGTRSAAVGFGGDLEVVDGCVSGDAGIVLGAGLADVFLLAVGADMLLVERGAGGVSVQLPGSLDRTRRSGRVLLSDVVVGDNMLPGSRDAALARARTLFAAEAVGGHTRVAVHRVDPGAVRDRLGGDPVATVVAGPRLRRHHDGRCRRQGGMRQVMRGVAGAMGPARHLDLRAEAGRARGVREPDPILCGPGRRRGDGFGVGHVVARAAQVLAHAGEDLFLFRAAGRKQPEARDQDKALYR